MAGRPVLIAAKEAGDEELVNITTPWQPVFPGINTQKKNSTGKINTEESNRNFSCFDLFLVF